MDRIWTPDEDVLAQYRSSQGHLYTSNRRIGFASSPVLEFLWGQVLDRVTFNWVEALRPVYVRIIEYGQGQTCDAMPWRVTINLNEDGKTIRRISQEVNVGLSGDVQHGHDLRCRTMPSEKGDYHD